MITNVAHLHRNPSNASPWKPIKREYFWVSIKLRKNFKIKKKQKTFQALNVIQD